MFAGRDAQEFIPIKNKPGMPNLKGSAFVKMGRWRNVSVLNYKPLTSLQPTRRAASHCGTGQQVCPCTPAAVLFPALFSRPFSRPLTPLQIHRTRHPIHSQHQIRRHQARCRRPRVPSGTPPCPPALPQRVVTTWAAGHGVRGARCLWCRLPGARICAAAAARGPTGGGVCAVHAAGAAGGGEGGMYRMHQRAFGTSRNARCSTLRTMPPTPNRQRPGLMTRVMPKVCARGGVSPNAFCRVCSRFHSESRLVCSVRPAARCSRLPCSPLPRAWLSPTCGDQSCL